MRLDLDGLTQLLRDGCEVLVSVDGTPIDIAPYVERASSLTIDDAEHDVRVTTDDGQTHGWVGRVHIRVIRPLRVGAVDGVVTADGT